MTEPTLVPRRDLMEGYVLDVIGATIADAVRTADISIPQYRQTLQTHGIRILTRYNPNELCRDLRTEPPDLQMCGLVIDEVQGRKERVIDELRVELEDARQELKTDMTRGERSFWAKRKKGLEEKIISIQAEDVTPEELHRAFIREDIALRSKFIPPEMREALEAVERERQYATVLGDTP